VACLWRTVGGGPSFRYVCELSREMRVWARYCGAPFGRLRSMAASLGSSLPVTSASSVPLVCYIPVYYNTSPIRSFAIDASSCVAAPLQELLRIYADEGGIYRHR
jgi:hypothetical protein